MVRHCVEGWRQATGNIWIVVALRDQVQNFTLTVGEFGKERGSQAGTGCGEEVDQALSDGGAKDSLSTANGANRAQNFVFIGIFEHITSCSSTQSREDGVIIFKHGDDQDTDVRTGGNYLAGGLDA